MRIVVFTGHRDVLDGHEQLIRGAVVLACETADEFVVGGASGADTMALGAVCDLADAGKRFPDVVIIVADTVARQPRDAQQMIGRAIMSLSPTIIELKLGYNAVSLKSRNQAMLDRAIPHPGSEVCAYWRGVYKSGTYSAMAYAERNGLTVSRIPL